MTKYMMLFRGGDARNLDLSPEEMQAHMEKWGIWMKSMGEKGQLVDGLPLGKHGKVLTGTQKVISDGPFAEGKEIVGGYMIINASSLEEAVEISKDCPIFEAEAGTVEVREVMNM